MKRSQLKNWRKLGDVHADSAELLITPRDSGNEFFRLKRVGELFEITNKINIKTISKLLVAVCLFSAVDAIAELRRFTIKYDSAKDKAKFTH